MFKPIGGSELAYNELQSRMSDVHKDNINVILSICHKDKIDKNKINILWQQLNYDQDNVKALSDESFIKNIDAFVFVSNWQYEKFKQIYNVPSNKSIVISNATNEFPEHNKPKTDKLKLIYTSMPNRGVDVLVDIMEEIERDDIELNVYSSTIIYGSDYHKSNNKIYTPLWERASKIPNVYIKGYATNQEIRAALLNSHIMVYPCTFEETSCMSAIEALASGCKLVCNNLGALKETAGIWADMITYDTDKKLTIKKMKKAINKAIDTYWNDDVQDKLKDQVDHYKKYWSWDVRIRQWENLFNLLMERKHGSR